MRLALLLLLPLPALAQEYQLELTGTASPVNSPYAPFSPFVAQWDMNLGAAQFTLLAGSANCVLGWSAVAPASNFSLTVSGQVVGTMPAPSVSMGGSGATNTCGGMLFDGMILSENGQEFGFDFDTPGLTHLGSNPTLTMLESWVTDGSPSGGSEYGFVFDSYRLSITPVSAPEPGTLVLFALGLAGLAVTRKLA